MLPCIQRRPLNGEEYGRVRLDPHAVRFHMVARADLPAHVRGPLLDIPFQPLGRDDGRSIYWNQSHVLGEDAALLQPRQNRLSGPQDKRQTAFRK